MFRNIKIGSTCIVVLLFLSACYSDVIHKRQIVDEIYLRFDEVGTISYRTQFEVFDSKGASHAAQSEKFFRSYEDKHGTHFSYNCKHRIGESYLSEQVYNAEENHFYTYSNDKTGLVSNAEPHFLINENQTALALPIWLKYLKETKEKFPEQIEVIDTLIMKEPHYVIAFSKPRGKTYDSVPRLCGDEDMMKLVVDARTAMPKSQLVGNKTFLISDLKWNSDYKWIWSKDSLPFYLAKGLMEHRDDITDSRFKKGQLFPNWKLESLGKKQLQKDNDPYYRLIFVFPNDTIFEAGNAKVLDRFSALDNLKVQAVATSVNLETLENWKLEKAVDCDVCVSQDPSLYQYVGVRPMSYLIDKNGILMFSITADVPNLFEMVAFEMSI